MNTTTVACSRNAPGARNVYYEWIGSRARHPTRTWVRDMPAPHGLPAGSLAEFLAQHVYNTSNQRGALMVRVYDDRRTEADLMRAEKRPHAEKFIRAYGLENQPICINDWAFPLAADDETPEAFWQRAADGILAVGATRVVIDAPGRARVQWESDIKGAKQ